MVMKEAGDRRDPRGQKDMGMYMRGYRYMLQGDVRDDEMSILVLVLAVIVVVTVVRDLEIVSGSRRAGWMCMTSILGDKEVVMLGLVVEAGVVMKGMSKTRLDVHVRFEKTKA